MNTAWNRRKREANPPVELRFVDLFMVAIGSLIFLQMAVALNVHELDAQEARLNHSSNALTLFAEALPADGIQETAMSLSNCFLFRFALSNYYANAERQFDANSHATNSIDPDYLLSSNNFHQDGYPSPFLFLTLPHPAKGIYHVAIRVLRNPNTPDQANEWTNSKVQVHFMVTGPAPSGTMTNIDVIFTNSLAKLLSGGDIVQFWTNFAVGESLQQGTSH